MSENTLDFKINGARNMDIRYGLHGRFAKHASRLFEGGITHTVLCDYGQMLFQGIPTRFGSIWLSKYAFDVQAKLSAEANAASLELMHMMDGCISFAPDGISAPLHMKPAHWQLMFLPYVKNEVVFPAGARLTTLDIHIDSNFLESLAPYFPKLDAFLCKSTAGKAGTISQHPIPISNEVNSIIGNFFKTRGCAKQQGLFLERHLSDWLATALESALFTEFDENILTASEEKKLVEIFEYMMANMSSTLTLSHLAKQAHINVSKLKNGFNVLFKKPVHQLLVQERMKKAVEMLRDGELTLDDIASLIGYQSYAGFSKEFKKMYGFSPSSFRRKAGT